MAMISSAMENYRDKSGIMGRTGNVLFRSNA
jgi:hypothetical protein